MYPPGLTYLEEFISPSEEAQLLAAIDHEPWLTDLKRRVQHYGYRYDYKARAVRRDMYLGKLPAWADGLVGRLMDRGLTPDRPDQLIVNEYLPGQGITPHVDCIPCFGPVVVSLSLGSSCVMELSRAQQKEAILLQRRSVLVFAHDARHLWRHSIPSRRSDTWNGLRSARGRRVSLTLRTVRLSVD